jgi:hypothetical protein
LHGRWPQFNVWRQETTKNTAGRTAACVGALGLVIMKTAYELAMERLNRTAPLTPLTEEQKREIAELESRYKARIAEREITLQQQIAAARAQGDWAKAAELEQQWVQERRKLQEELEARKEKVRQGKS